PREGLAEAPDADKCPAWRGRNQLLLRSRVGGAHAAVKVPIFNLENSMIDEDEACGASKTGAINNSRAGVQETPKRLLSKRELAGVLNVSERTIENWLAQKRIPRLRLSNRLTRFNLPRVEAALARYE